MFLSEVEPTAIAQDCTGNGRKVISVPNMRRSGMQDKGCGKAERTARAFSSLDDHPFGISARARL